MAGSSFGTIFRVTTFGESHGEAVGALVDGCPSGIELNESIVQAYLDLRKPGQSKFSTQRNEADQIHIMSGVFQGKTTGTPILLLANNSNQISSDYHELESVYRPGHADYTFDIKYGYRDYRGGGRSSGRETLGRVAAGAIAIEFLKTLGIQICAYTKSIGAVECRVDDYIDLLYTDKSIICHDRLSEASMQALMQKRMQNSLFMPDQEASELAEQELKISMERKNSLGGMIECVVTGLPAGLGDPVFDKLDAKLAQAILSIGSVKGIGFGSGFQASVSTGMENNDSFTVINHEVRKTTNHAGGVLGGISDGSDLFFQIALKPTPSIYATQQTITKDLQPVELSIKGRHDPVIVPRAVVVVEAMTAITLVDSLLLHMANQSDKIKDFYTKSNK